MIKGILVNFICEAKWVSTHDLYYQNAFNMVKVCCAMNRYYVFWLATFPYKQGGEWINYACFVPAPDEVFLVPSEQVWALPCEVYHNFFLESL